MNTSHGPPGKVMPIAYGPSCLALMLRTAVKATTPTPAPAAAVTSPTAMLFIQIIVIPLSH